MTTPSGIELDFDDIFEVWEQVWWRFDNGWLWVAAIFFCVVVFVGAYGIVWALFCRKPRVVTPRERFLVRLETAFSVQVDADDERYKNFYVEALAGAKEYIAAVQHDDVCGLTDEEFVVYVKYLAANDSGWLTWYTTVQSLAQHGGMVKFAREMAREDAMNNDYAVLIGALNGQEAHRNKSM